MKITLKTTTLPPPPPPPPSRLNSVVLELTPEEAWGLRDLLGTEAAAVTGAAGVRPLFNELTAKLFQYGRPDGSGHYHYPEALLEARRR